MGLTVFWVYYDISIDCSNASSIFTRGTSIIEMFSILKKHSAPFKSSPDYELFEFESFEFGSFLSACPESCSKFRGLSSYAFHNSSGSWYYLIIVYPGSDERSLLYCRILLLCILFPQVRPPAWRQPCFVCQTDLRYHKCLLTHSHISSMSIILNCLKEYNLK